MYDYPRQRQRTGAKSPVPTIGVIASRLAGEIYGLETVQSGIEDLQHNYTRFFIIGKGEAERTENAKTSLVFATPHSPGALHGCLGEFAQRGINLMKIESRPRRNRPWQYVFYLDFAGHWQDADCGAALLGLLNRAAFVKLLGSFPPAPAPQEDEGTVQAAVLQI